jgi:hypothetical protein
MQNIVEEESKLKNFLYSKNELDVSEERMPSVASSSSSAFGSQKHSF